MYFKICALKKGEFYADRPCVLSCYEEVMDTQKLSSFFRDIASPPEDDADLSVIAEKIGGLCGVSLVAVALKHEQGLRIGVGVAGTEVMGKEVFGAVKEFFRRELTRLNEGLVFGGLKTVPVDIRSLSLVNAKAIKNLVLVPLFVDRRYFSADLNPVSEMESRGCVVLCVENELAPVQELSVLIAARWISSLLEVGALEATIKQRSQFLSIASHELKTPLTAIYGILQLQERLLRQKKDEPPEEQLERQHAFLKMVIRQVERLNELIDGLLDVSRIQNGRFVVEPSEADVAVIVRDSVLPRMKLIAQEASVVLKVEAPEGLIAWVDPVRFEEVVVNLLMNAIRFSPEGGTVWLQLSQSDGSFRLSVRDQGPDVPMGDRERIFYPFEKTQRTGRLGGMGLGLFIARQIAQLHGGNVALIESVAGKGNLFEACFPIKMLNALSA